MITGVARTVDEDYGRYLLVCNGIQSTGGAGCQHPSNSSTILPIAEHRQLRTSCQAKRSRITNCILHNIGFPIILQDRIAIHTFYRSVLPAHGPQGNPTQKSNSTPGTVTGGRSLPWSFANLLDNAYWILGVGPVEDEIIPVQDFVHVRFGRANK